MPRAKRVSETERTLNTKILQARSDLDRASAALNDARHAAAVASSVLSAYQDALDAVRAGQVRKAPTPKTPKVPKPLLADLSARKDN